MKRVILFTTLMVFMSLTTVADNWDTVTIHMDTLAQSPPVFYGDITDVLVYDLSGKTVFDGSYNQFTCAVLAHGVYIVRYRVNLKVKKVIK